MRLYGSKRPSKAARTAALYAMLIMTRDIDAKSPESLEPSYGLGPKTTAEMLKAERDRRS